MVRLVSLKRFDGRAEPWIEQDPAPLRRAMLGLLIWSIALAWDQQITTGRNSMSVRSAIAAHWQKWLWMGLICSIFWPAGMIRVYKYGVESKHRWVCWVAFVMGPLGVITAIFTVVAIAVFGPSSASCFVGLGSYAVEYLIAGLLVICVVMDT